MNANAGLENGTDRVRGLLNIHTISHINGLWKPSVVSVDHQRCRWQTIRQSLVSLNMSQTITAYNRICVDECYFRFRE